MSVMASGGGSVGRRTAWLVAVPLLAGTAALVLGAAATAAFAVVLTPYETPAPGVLEAGRGVLASTLGDLTTPRALAPVAAGVLLAGLTWAVGLGLGAQRLFPRRRRALPAFAAVLVSAAVAWVAVGVLAASEGDVWAVTVDDAVDAVLVASVAAGLLVFVPAGYFWQPVVGRPMGASGAPRPAPHPATRPIPRADRPVPRPAPRPAPRRPARAKPVTAPRPAGLL